jgi:hypothetical protein
MKVADSTSARFGQRGRAVDAPTAPPLSGSWKNALLFIHDHYARHPIEA